jgi:hypothetical protein
MTPQSARKIEKSQCRCRQKNQRRPPSKRNFQNHGFFAGLIPARDIGWREINLATDPAKNYGHHL